MISARTGGPLTRYEAAAISVHQTLRVCTFWASFVEDYGADKSRKSLQASTKRGAYQRGRDAHNSTELQTGDKPAAGEQLLWLPDMSFCHQRVALRRWMRCKLNGMRVYRAPAPTDSTWREPSSSATQKPAERRRQRP